MKLGIENRKQVIVAALLGLVALLIVAYWFLPSSSTIASTTPGTTATEPHALSASAARPGARHGSGSTSAKKERPAQSLDPTLHLQQLAAAEQIKYEGSGRNIFVSQADAVIPTPQAPGVHGQTQQRWGDIHAAKCGATASNTPEVFRLREPARRTEKDFSLQGR